MSKIIVNKIITKLGKLDEYLKYLSEIQKINKKTFIKDFHFFGAAERYLQLAIEASIDIGKLVIIAKNLKKPEDNQDIFTILYDEKIISKKLIDELIGIVGFRNILVHDYEKIDREIVYKKLQNNLSNFKDFKKQILRFVGEN